jgi:hypothetical protein
MSEYRDRRTGLILFGALLIATGGVNALMAAVLAAGPSLAPEAAALRSTPSAIRAGIVTYGLLAVLFVWLGTGSVLTRRWAPPLILTVAWLWLMTGLVGIVVTVLLLPSVFTMVELQSGPMPDGVRTSMTIVMVGALGAVMVLVPGALVLFYRSRHVLATCAARDPVPRWTDGRPTWLIGLSLSLALMAAALLPAVLFYDGLALCFGALVVGVPGMLINLALAAVWGACAWSTLRLEPRGWWATAISVTIGTASAVVTLAVRDPTEIWRAAGFPAEQVTAVIAPTSGWMIGLALACWLSLMGYLVYVRERFRSRE